MKALRPDRVAVRIALALSVLALAAGGCAPAPGASGPARTGARPNVLRVAITSDITLFHERLKPVSPSPAGPYVNAGLTVRDHNDVLRPVLLERLPSQYDGTLEVHPDGSMRSVLQLRPGLKWQDGHPLTAADFVLAHQVFTDPEIPMQTTLPERSMSSVGALDHRTIEVRWARVSIEAASPEANHLAPIPSHLMGELYARDKNAFINSPFWSTAEYVGAGPFRVASRDPGVRVTLQANPHFVFGRPAIDGVDITVAPDANAVVVRVLADEVDWVHYQDINALQAAELERTWASQGKGRILYAMVVIRGLAFQHRDVPNHQPALRDLRVRQAVMHALDREEIGRLETAGRAGRADTVFYPEHRLWDRVQAVLTTYPFDPRRTELLLNQAGWTKGPDGLFRNAAGATLDVEATASSDYPRTPLILADMLRRAGFDARPFVQPEALDADTEHRASYPGMTAETFSVGPYTNLTTANAALPENRFRGRNRGNYSNPQLDALHDRYFSTLLEQDRDDVLIELERLVTADVAMGPMYYQVRPHVAINGLEGIQGYPFLWNVWEWRFAS